MALNTKTPKIEPLDDDEIEQEVAEMIRSAASYCDDEVGIWRANVSDYLNGRPFGNEVDGRSKVIITEVKDTINAIVPQIMRQFFSPEHVVHFEATRQDQEEQAAQATDYIVDHVLRQENEAFRLFHDVIQDGLTYRMGVAKYWSEDREPEHYTLNHVTQEEMEALLVVKEEVKITKKRRDGEIPPTPEQIQAYQQALQASQQPPQAAPGPQNAPQAPPQPPQPTPTFTVECTVRQKDKRIRVVPVPPEEFIYTQDTRRWADGRCVAHRPNDMTRGKLIALGIDPEEIDEHGGAGGTTGVANDEVLARSLTGSDPGTYGTSLDDAHARVDYCEAYIRLDVDGDGVAELRRICTIGPGYHIVSNDPVDRIPFAIYLPKPIAHTVESRSISDETMDMQRVKSSVIRAQLDSLAAAIHPRLGFVEGQVSPADIMNHAIGAPLRMRQPGMVTPIVIPFLGAEATPILDFLSGITESRTGQSKGSMGLDVNAMQSSTKQAVGAQLGAAQMQTEMLVGMFAETFLRPLMSGLLREFIATEPRASVVKLRGHWVDIDPATWDANMSVVVSMSFGAGYVEDRLEALMEIATKQELQMSVLGPAGPLVGIPEYGNTLRLAAKLRGFKNPDLFFKQLPPNWQPPAPPPPQPSPEEKVAQAQLQMAHEKNMRELAIKEAELQLSREKQAHDIDFQYTKLAQEMDLKRFAIVAQFKGQMTEAQLDAEVGHTAAHLKAMTDMHATQTGADVDTQGQQQDAMVDHHANMTNAMIDHHANERAADTADAAQQADAQAPESDQ